MFVLIFSIIVQTFDRVDEDDRYRQMLHDLLGDAPQDQSVQPVPTMRHHGNGVYVPFLGDADDLVCGTTGMDAAA